MSNTRVLSWVPLLVILLVVAAAPAQATTITVVDDSWADGDRTDGADPLDSNWWTTTNSSAIEVTTGSLGLVTGTSGRGIRTTFASQNLAIGESITATFRFLTPTTVGDNRSSAFRVGFFDTLGRAGLEADLSASSSSPEPLYDGIPGYMVDFDVNTGEENVNFRKRDVLDTQGRLMATTSAYDSIGGGGDPYSFAPGFGYVGVFSITRTGADEVELSSSLSQGGFVLSTNTETDDLDTVSTYGMLGFHANSNTFGSSNSTGDPDNGLEFVNVTIEVNRIPEPASASLALAALLMGARRRRVA